MKEQKKQIAIDLTFLRAKSLSEQIRTVSGLKDSVVKKYCDEFESDLNMIYRLLVRGFLTQTQILKAKKKLARRICDTFGFLNCTVLIDKKSGKYIKLKIKRQDSVPNLS